MVPTQAGFDKVHFQEHEGTCNQEQRKLTALVAQGKPTFVAHDGIHHGEAGAESAHKLLDEHESADHSCDGGSLNIYGQGSLVTNAGLVLLFLEHDETHGKVEGAYADEESFAVGDAGHEEGSHGDKAGKPYDDGGDDRDLSLVVQHPDDVGVQHAHESGNGVCCSDGQSYGDVGEAEGDGNGGRDRLQLGVLQVGAEGSQGGDHENQKPVVEGKMEV